MLEGLGRTLIWIGGGLLALGLLFVLIGKIPGLGRLPGDILIKRENVTILHPARDDDPRERRADVVAQPDCAVETLSPLRDCQFKDRRCGF